MSLRLHPKFGVNPSIEICFWCGKDKGTALWGNNYKGKAPERICLDYEPCDSCKDFEKEGIKFIEVTNHPIGPRPMIASGVYPTGRYTILKETALDMILDLELRQSIFKHRKCFCFEEDYEKLFSLNE